MKTFSTNAARRSHTTRARTRAAAFVAVIATVGFGGLFSLVGCQTGLDGAGSANAPADVVAGKNVAGQVSAEDGLRKELTPEERKRKIAEFLAKPEVKQTSQGLEELAKLVAVAVEDEALRNQIYARCMEKFDGETNVLWKQLDGDAKLRSNGAGFSARIDGLAAKARSANAGAGVVSRLGGVNAALAQFEKTFNAPLHLYWTFPENWDKKTTPLIAFVPRDTDPDLRQSIPAFDGKGKEYVVDKNAELAKRRPVIVITFNERTSADGKLKQGLITNAQSQGSASASTGGKNVSGKAQSIVAKLTTTQARFWMEWDEIFWDGRTEFWSVASRPTYDAQGGYWHVIDDYENGHPLMWRNFLTNWSSGWTSVNQPPRFFSNPYYITFLGTIQAQQYIGPTNGQPGLSVTWVEADGGGTPEWDDFLDRHFINTNLYGQTQTFSGTWVEASYIWSLP